MPDSSHPRMITVFTPSFADEDNTNAQNLTVKEVVARLDPQRFGVVMLGAGAADPRIAVRPNTQILKWRKHGNTGRLMLRLVTNPPDVYFFPRESSLDAAFLAARGKLTLKTALVTYVISGGLENSNRPLIVRAIREADAVAGNSQWMTETARRLGGREVETVCDGIDRRFYYPPSQDALSTRANVILYAGSFRPYKRADLVVREAARFPPWEFRLAGTGEDEGTCRELALKANCTNIRFLGHLSARELGEEMRRAAIFFFPSELEGHPQVLGQAAACGLPCVARSSYRPDYVVHGVTGLLADSEGDLGAALGRLCGDHSLRAGMSQAAIAHTAKFEWDDITRQWAGIMEKAIVQRRNIRQRRVA